MMLAVCLFNAGMISGAGLAILYGVEYEITGREQGTGMNVVQPRNCALGPEDKFVRIFDATPRDLTTIRGESMKGERCQQILFLARVSLGKQY